MPVPHSLSHSVLAAAVAATLLIPVALPAQRRPLPTPASVIGFEPGTDRKLPSWKLVTDYFAALDAASPRIMVRTIGRTTLGRPFIAAFIADSSTLARLPRYREIQRRLADPRLQMPGDREKLLADGKTVVLVTSSIHSTEVGGILTPLVLAHRLVARDDAETRSIRANTLVILVPSLNPDGVDIVGNWYRSTLGTPHEGSSPPELYHKYVGHDNNRDWYAFTQVETQLTVDSLHNVWHPQVVNDIHQQQSNGSRIFIPPYMDPIEPNVDPIITAGVNQMGMSMTWRMTAAGMTGIANNASYDAWTPARAYQHYHAGIRILTETASADLATPIDILFDSLRMSRGYDPRVTSWNFLTLWPGGRWGIGDIVRYQTAATWALLAESARDRATWLESFAAVGARAVKGRAAAGRANWPVAFVIPAQQLDQVGGVGDVGDVGDVGGVGAAVATLLRILQRGQVEVRRATAAFTSANTRYPQDSYVIFTAQPYGAFAKALLEKQTYPDLREYPGGPPKRPYDVTAHTLPLLMGITVSAITDSMAIPTTEPIPAVPAPKLVAPGLSGQTSRRIAMYRSYAPSMDEGWTRWILEQYSIAHTSVVDREIRAGNLKQRFDVIILPDQSAETTARGAFFENYPDSLKGGLGDAGAAAIRAFVEEGGTLVAFNDASLYAIQTFNLPVRNVLQGVSPRDFYAPGSIMALELDRAHPIAMGMTARSIAWFEDGPAFEVTDTSRARVVARYPREGDPLLSGWLLGGTSLNGRAALVDVSLGKGHVILFGFRPQYRAQTMATYPLIWSALRGW